MARRFRGGVDIGIQLEGHRELSRALDGMKASAARAVLRPAVNFALTPLSRRARSLAPKETGALRKSIGKVVRTYPKYPTPKRPSTVLGLVGPRNDMRVRDDRGRWRDPTKYAHMIEFGTLSHTILPSNRRALKFASGKQQSKTYNLDSGQFAAAAEHKGYVGRPFLRPAFQSTRGKVRKRLSMKTMERIRARWKKEKAKQGLPIRGPVQKGRTL